MGILHSGKTLIASLIIAGSLLLVGCGNKTASGTAGIEGVGNFTYAIANGRATLSVVFKDLHIDAGASIPLARPAGAYVELSPDFASSGTLFTISVPIESLFGERGNLPNYGLPDGRAIPFVKNGVLGVLTATLPVVGTTYLYIGQDVFGIFFPMNFGKLPVMVSSKIRDDKGNLLGMIVGVPKSTKGNISGVLFLFPVEGSATAKQLQKIQ